MDRFIIWLKNRREVNSRLFFLFGISLVLLSLVSCSSHASFEWTETKDVQFSKIVQGEEFLLFEDYIWIIDDIANEIQIFDRKGDFLKKIGGTGKGPGEFVKISMIGNNASYGVIYDARLSRLTIYEPDGEIKKISNFSEVLLPLGTDIAVISNNRVLITGYSGSPGFAGYMLHIYDWDEESFYNHGIPISINLEQHNREIPNYYVWMKEIGNNKVFLSYAYKNKLMIYDYEKNDIVKEWSLDEAEKIKKQQEYLIENVYFGPITHNTEYYFIPSINKNKPGSYVIDKTSKKCIGFIQKFFRRSYQNVLYNVRDSILYTGTVTRGFKKSTLSVSEKPESKDIIKIISEKSNSAINPESCRLISDDKSLYLYCFGGKIIIEYDVISKTFKTPPFRGVKSFNTAIDIEFKENPYFTLRRIGSGPGLFQWDKSKNQVKMVTSKIRNHFAVFHSGLIYQDVQEGYLFEWKDGSKTKLPFQGILNQEESSLKDIFLNEMLMTAYDKYLVLACKNRNILYLLNRNYNVVESFCLPGIPENYIAKTDIKVKRIPGGHEYCIVDKPQNIAVKIDDNQIYLISQLIPGSVAKFDIESGKVSIIETGFKDIISMEIFELNIYLFGKEKESGIYKIEKLPLKNEK